MGWLSRGNGQLAEHMSCVDGMPNVGQGSGWTERQWRKAPVRTVPLRRLVGTNRGGHLDPARVQRYLRGGGGKPYVVEHGGRLYIAEGHHRCAAAIQRGDRTIRAHVLPGGR